MAVTLAHAKQIEERARAAVARREQQLTEAEARKADTAEIDRRRARVVDAAAKHAVTLERVAKAARNKSRVDKISAGMTKRLDALAADAPAITQKWREDRAKEPKRLAKLKKDIAKRTSRDVTARPDWMRKPVALPPPIEQPKLDEPAPPIAPPREGLIEGTYSVMSLDRLFAGLADIDPLPAVWTERRVAQRLIDAFATLRVMPERGNPAGYGAMWPAYRHDFGELAIQAGAGTLPERARFRPRASADEIALMEDALNWIGQFLSAENAWARIDLISWADRFDVSPDDEPRPRRQLQMIADALNSANEVVR